VSKESELDPYAGRWVATIRGRVVAQGGTPDQVLQAAKSSRPKEIPHVMFVPTATPLLFTPLLERIRSVLPPDAKVYLVGGAVRDAMLSRPLHDYDFVLPGDTLRIARTVANRIGGAYFPLDETRKTARIIYTDETGVRYVLDFATFQGAGLEEDLQARDFTVNAIAVDLKNPQALLDPLNGAMDLWNKNLRACSPTSFVNDPVRVLRAIRIAAGLGFKIHADTRKWMREAVPLIGNVSTERLRDELFRILEGPQPHVSIRALDMLGAVAPLLPELSPLKGVHQSPPHTKDVWEHTLDTLKHLEALLRLFDTVPDPDDSPGLFMGLTQLLLGRYRERITKHLQTREIPERNVRSLTFLAALYHDIAKPRTFHLDDQGRTRFFGHERLGAEIIASRGEAIRLSNKEIDRLQLIVRNHMRPAQLARDQKDLSHRAIYRFFRDTQDVGIDICLLSLADLLATYGVTMPQERWERQLDIIRTLMEAWWEQPDERIRPPVLVTGHMLMAEFGLDPGPKIGSFLEMIREAQVVGDVVTQSDAFNLVRVALQSPKP